MAIASGSGTPGFNAGLISGVRVAETLKQQIWKGDFVDFWDLIHPDVEYKCDGRPKDSSNKDRTLNTIQWTRAFLGFVSIRTERFPEENEALLRYGTFICDLMEQDLDWSLYDTRFRWDKSRDPALFNIPWCQIRQQLLNEAARSTGTKAKPHVSASTTLRASRSGIPVGYCFNFHEADAVCLTPSKCGFLHKCPKCHGSHALYRHGRALEEDSPRRSRSSPSRSSRSNKGSRRR